MSLSTVETSIAVTADSIRAKADALRKLIDSVDDGIIGKFTHAVPVLGTWATALDQIVDVLDDLIDLADTESRGIAGIKDNPGQVSAGPSGSTLTPPTP